MAIEAHVRLSIEGEHSPAKIRLWSPASQDDARQMAEGCPLVPHRACI